MQTIKNPNTIMSGGGGKKYTHYITITQGTEGGKNAASIEWKSDDSTLINSFSTVFNLLKNAGFYVETINYSHKSPTAVYPIKCSRYEDSQVDNYQVSDAFVYAGTHNVGSGLESSSILFIGWVRLPNGGISEVDAASYSFSDIVLQN